MIKDYISLSNFFIHKIGYCENCIYKCLKKLLGGTWSC